MGYKTAWYAYARPVTKQQQCIRPLPAINNVASHEIVRFVADRTSQWAMSRDPNAVGADVNGVGEVANTVKASQKQATEKEEPQCAIPDRPGEQAPQHGIGGEGAVGEENACRQCQEPAADEREEGSEAERVHRGTILCAA